MKAFIHVLLLLGCVTSYGQGTIIVLPGTSVNSTGEFVVVKNFNIVNNGSIIQTGTSNFRLSGEVNTSYSGSGNTSLQKLYMSKTIGSVLALQQTIAVQKQVIFEGGLVDLGASIVDLGTTGALVGESESTRFFSSDTGYVMLLANLNMPSSATPGNLGAVITTNKNMGPTLIKRGHLAQANVSGGNPGIKRYYDITPSFESGLKATLRLHYFDEELNGLSENTLELFKKVKNGWSSSGFSSRNITLNYVEKTGINALSKWTLAPSAQKGQPIVNNESANPFPGTGLVIAPNPVRDRTNILFNAETDGMSMWSLFNENGQLVLSFERAVRKGANKIEINLSDQRAGGYFLRCGFDGRVEYIKLIKL